MKILIASAIHPNAIECLSREHDVIFAKGAKQSEFEQLMHDREVLIFRSGVIISRQLLASAPALKLIVRAGCGLDNIDLQGVEEHGIVLHRIPRPAAKAVSELAMSLLLSLAREVFQADSACRQGHWVKEQIEGRLLYRSVLGIVGVGNIGSQVGRLGNALGMKVIGCVEHPTEEREFELLSQGILLRSFDYVVENADFLSIHVPLQDSTRNLIDADVLARMKKGAFLANLARGGVLDEVALLAQLRAGHIRGAALDVHAREGEGNISLLAGLPNVILTPHIGANTQETQREIGDEVLATVAEFAASTSRTFAAGAVAEAA